MNQSSVMRSGLVAFFCGASPQGFDSDFCCVRRKMRWKCGVCASPCVSSYLHDLEHTNFDSYCCVSAVILHSTEYQATQPYIIYTYGTQVYIIYDITYHDSSHVCHVSSPPGQPFFLIGVVFSTAHAQFHYKLSRGHLAGKRNITTLSLSLGSCCCPLPRPFLVYLAKMMVGEPEEMPAVTDCRKQLLTMDQRNSSSDLFISISGLIGKRLVVQTR